jgi:hypothetical protein
LGRVEEEEVTAETEEDMAAFKEDVEVIIPTLNGILRLDRSSQIAAINSHQTDLTDLHHQTTDLHGESFKNVPFEMGQ